MNQPSGQDRRPPQWQEQEAAQKKAFRQPHGPMPLTQRSFEQNGFQGGSYTGFNAYAHKKETEGRSRSSRRWTLIGGVTCVLLLGASGVGAWLLGVVNFNDVLDETSVEQGVTKVLTNHYGEANVKNANCPSRQAVKAQHSFECTVEVSGEEKTIDIRVLNDKPEFEVGAPR